MVETIPDLFYASIERDLPVALAHRVDGAYRPISHRELQARVERLALALEGAAWSGATAWPSCPRTARNGPWPTTPAPFRDSSRCPSTRP